MMALLALVLAGCGGSLRISKVDKLVPQISSIVLRQDLHRTLQQKSFRVSSFETARVAGVPISVLSTNGFEAHPSRDPSATFSLTLPAPVGTVKVLLIQKAEYLSVPRVYAGTLPSSVSWILLDPQAISQSALGAGASSLFSDSESNPSALLFDLDGLFGATVAVLARGVVVNGTTTTEYGARLNLVTALRRSHGQYSAASLKRLELALGPRPTHCQVWVDHLGRIRKLQVHIVVHLSAHQQADISEVLDLSNFGVAVTVTAPSTSSVAELPGISTTISG
jgi:hypothetical protein